MWGPSFLSCFPKFPLPVIMCHLHCGQRRSPQPQMNSNVDNVHDGFPIQRQNSFFICFTALIHLQIDSVPIAGKKIINKHPVPTEHKSPLLNLYYSGFQRMLLILEKTDVADYEYFAELPELRMK